MPKKKKNGLLAPLLITIIVVLCVGGIAALTVWVFILEPPPWYVTLLMGFLVLLMPVATLYGIVASFIERSKEIKSGEEDEASKY